jgi:hypothetical protein
MGLTLLVAMPATAQSTHYVDAAATGDGSGGSWAHAFTNLQSALSAAMSNDQVWVAEGDYRPGSMATETFTVWGGVAVIGGFAAGMSALGERDEKAHPVVLSGDIDANGILDTNNAYHVVTVAGAGVWLDGLTITMGHASTSVTPHGFGGGLYVPGNFTLTVSGCRFVQNAAYQRGGAAYFSYSSLAAEGVVFTNCVFVSNQVTKATANYGGGAIFLNGQRPLALVDCRLAENTSAYYGGAVYVAGGAGVTLSRCALALNVATNAGGAIYGAATARGVTPNLMRWEDTDFWGNRAQGSAHGGAANIDGDARVGDAMRRCRFFDNVGYNGGALALGNYDGAIEDCVFSGNRVNNNFGGAAYLTAGSDATLRRVVMCGHAVGTGGGAVYSPAAQNCRPLFEDALLAGNRSGNLGGAAGLLDLTAAGAVTSAWVHCTIADNRAVLAGNGGGGLYLSDGTSVVYNTCLYGNTTGGGGPQVYVGANWSRVVVGSSDLQGGLAAIYSPTNPVVQDAGGNLDTDPLRVPDETGAWSTAVSYSNALGLSVLTDADAVWPAGGLVGRLLNANTNGDNLAYYIVSNTRSSITVLGAATNGTSGAAYRVRDYRPRAGSPLVDAAEVAWSTAADLVGTLRPEGAVPDIGAYERTPDADAPEGVGGLAASGELDQIRLSWTNPTNRDFDGVLILRDETAPPAEVPVDTNYYAVGDVLGGSTVVHAGRGSDAEPGAASEWVDRPLPEATTYFYVVFPRDGVPNYATAATASATTLDDTVVPGPVAGLTAARGNHAVTLAWTNPPDADFAGIVIVRRAGAAPTGAPAAGTGYAAGEALGDGVVVYAAAVGGATASWTDTGLTHGPDYYYAVFARDEALNYSVGSGAWATPGEMGVVFVDHAAVGLNNGQSWGHAFTNLTEALMASGGGVRVWVAEGIYRPGFTNSASFALTNGVSLYGGFTNGMAFLADRDWDAHRTVLNGDIDGDELLDADNSLHVVTIGGTDVRMDGLTVVAGNASGTVAPASQGGGVYVFGNQSPTLMNCRFVGNSAYSRGGAVHLNFTVFGTLGPAFTNCVFASNTVVAATAGGGALSMFNQRPLEIVQCRFTDNVSAYRGGAVYGDGVGLFMRECVLARNVSTNSGGAVYTLGPRGTANPMAVEDCVFFGNRTLAANTDGGAAYLDGSSQTADAIRRCRFYGNGAARFGGALVLSAFDGVLEDCAFSGDLAGTQGGGLYLTASDATLRRLVVAGHAVTQYGGGVYWTGVAGMRLEDALIVGNRATTRGGGVAYEPTNWRTGVVVHCTLADNRTTTTAAGAGNGGGGLYVGAVTSAVANSVLAFNRSGSGLGHQMHVNGASGQVRVEHADLVGGLGGIHNPTAAMLHDAGGNLDANPLPVRRETGAWTADSEVDAWSATTRLTAGPAGWTAGRLSGMLLTPDTNADSLAYLVLTNTADTLTVLGLVSNVLAGQQYLLADYRLLATSPCVDSASSTWVTALDVAGATRPQGTGADMGAYERAPDAAAPGGVMGLSATGGLDLVQLSWTNPPEADFEGVLVVRRAGVGPTGTPAAGGVYEVGQALGDGVVVYSGRGASGEPGVGSAWTDEPLPQLTEFHYAVFAYDGAPNYAPGAVASATTLLDEVPPGSVTELTAVGGDCRVALSWRNPTDSDFEGVTVVGRLNASPASAPLAGQEYVVGDGIGGGQVLYAGSGASFTHSGIGFGARYYYQVFARDERPNYAVGAAADATTDALFATNPVVWLPFTNGAGTVATDASGHGNDGTLLASVTWGAGQGPTPPGGTATLDAVDFAGTEDVANSVRIEDSSSLAFDKTRGTIAFWINPSMVKDRFCFVKTDPFGSSTGVEVAKNAVGLFGWPQGWGGAFYSSMPAGVGVWTHVVFTWDAAQPVASNMQFYINGQLDAASTGRRVFTATTTGAWILGQDYTVDNGNPFHERYYAGKMADFVVYAEPLPLSQVQLVYSNGVAGVMGGIGPVARPTSLMLILR